MHAGLGFGIGLAVAVVGGIALWPNPTHARAALPARPPAVTAPSAGPLGSEEVLAKALLALLPVELQRQAVLDERVGPELCLARSVPPTAIASGRGVMVADLAPAAAGVFWRLLQHCAAALPRELAGSDLARAEAVGSGALAFVFAGDRALGGPCYVRLHGPHFVVEWLRTPAGQVHSRWRDFERDAEAPWLRDEVRRVR